MKPDIIFTIIILIIVVQSLIDKLLTLLNMRQMKSELPPDAVDIYSADEYKKSQEYNRTKSRFKLIVSLVQLFILLAALIGGVFPILDQFIRQMTSHPILQGLLFFGMLGLAVDIISLPFQIYATFIIEQIYGFNRTTPRIFITDKLKSWLLAAIIGGGFFSLIAWIYINSGPWFILLALAVIILFSVFMNMFYTTLILPLFNKLQPLPDGELRQSIFHLTEKTGFPLQQIYIIDSSKRSTKSNAYFSGLGKKKKIILFDTLIEKHSIDELVAILAHEIGHYKHKHILKGLFLGIIETSVLLLLLYIFLQFPIFQQALGAQEPSFHFGLFTFALLYSPVSFIVGIISNRISRHFERQADTFAITHSDAHHFIAALKKLTAYNYSNLTPHPLYVKVYYSHPPVLQRIEYIKHSLRKNQNP